MNMEVAPQPRARQWASPLLPQGARCTLQEAICVLANEPIAEPADPCLGAPALKDFPQVHTSRWLLAILVVMRALAGWRGEGDPPMSASARALEQRLGFSTGAAAPWFDDGMWSGRVATMRAHCAFTGKAAAYWLKTWTPLEPSALAHLEELERRNQNLLAAAELLRDAVMHAHGPVMCGRDQANGAFGEVARATLFDQRVRWKTDKAAILWEHCIRFTSGLEAPMGGFDDVCFSTAEIMALVQSRSEPSNAGLERRRTRQWAAQQAALRVFPDGPPAGMLVTRRNDVINAELVKQGAEALGQRTLRSAIRALKKEGHWRHG